MTVVGHSQLVCNIPGSESYRMEILYFVRTHLLAWPTLAKAAVALALIVGVPPLSRRLRIPGIVGLLLAGVLIGPHGLALIGENHPIAAFFSEIGKLLLMFFAGLEVDLSLLQKAKHRLYVFGVLTTLSPLLLGTGVGLLFGYHTVQAIVIGSLLASHTLLGLPIITKLGGAQLEPVIVTVGATVISDTLSLVVFSVCVSIFNTGFSLGAVGLQLLEIAIFVPFILVVVSRAGAWLLHKVTRDENAYFVVLLAILTTAGVIAKSINLPGIVGAFLAGLAVNAAVQHKPAKDKLEFFGNSLFIPIFFVVTGFLISPVEFFETMLANSGLVACVIFALLLGKRIAAEVAGRAFSYGPAERNTMWALTLPQVAATLAATLVAYDTVNNQGERLLDVKLLNVVIVLMLTTAILGPVLTETFARKMIGEPRSSALVSSTPVSSANSS
jgi:Kef-type K+ transport system membrane component KefB